MRLLAIVPALAAVVLLATAPAPAPAAAPAASGELACWRKGGTGCGDLYLRSARSQGAWRP